QQSKICATANLRGHCRATLSDLHFCDASRIVTMVSHSAARGGAAPGSEFTKKIRYGVDQEMLKQ
ncbi:hypothetical protein, partial [Corynebacterium sp.]|uniref:hypothetical protein n=1 Tax=Corynebacterium sp. TaxID=1720 RepID=UPI002F3FF804